eukprot:jgi/Botrbrau1/5542/Bobra.0023s0026.1
MSPRREGDLEQVLTHESFSTGSLRPAQSPWRVILSYSALYVTAILGLLLLDAVWITFISRSLGFDYFSVVETIQGKPAAQRPAGLLAYLVMTYAVTDMASNWVEAAKLGFVIYSIFDFTSTFMYIGWTLPVAILDTLWGTSLFATVGALLQLLRGNLQLT